MTAKSDPTVECGVARLGEVESVATWKKVGGDCLEIRFDPVELSPEQEDELSRYRNMPQRMPFKLPKQHRAREVAVIGFDRMNGKFYLSLADT